MCDSRASCGGPLRLLSWYSSPLPLDVASSLGSALWVLPELLRPDAPDRDHTEAQLATFNIMPVRAIRLEFEMPPGSGAYRSLVIPAQAQSLRAMFNEVPRTFSLGRAAWKQLIGPTASLQANCNSETTNFIIAENTGALREDSSRHRRQPRARLLDPGFVHRRRR